MFEKKFKLYVIHAKGGCTFWRSFLPAQFMQKNGLADVRYCDLREATQAEIADGLRWCDLAHVRGLMGTEGVAMLRKYQSLGIKIAVDHDDLFFNVSPFNTAYRTFGIEEIEVKDPTTGDIKKLWEDGKNGFDIKQNKVRFHSYKTILEEADIVTTTTVYLKEAMAEISGSDANIRVVPNAVDFSQWRPMPEIRDKFKDKFRFGWTVSNSHGEDWIYIKPALVKFLNEHPDAKFVCLGDTSMDILPGLPKGQVEWYPFSDLWEYHYPLRMAMLGLDCAIAPLADLEFNKCKSPLKYAEYTAFGWPTIAQNMTPYKEHIIHGDTGLLAGSIDEWTECLNSLYHNKDLGRKLHFGALHTCKAFFDIENVCREWAQVYREVIGDKVLC